MQDGREITKHQLEERNVNNYGIIRWNLKDQKIKKLTGISADKWTDFTNNLSQINEFDKLIVSPELITCTEIESENVTESKELIESRIEQTKKFSMNFPETTIVLGTAIFGEEEKPKNGVLFIKNGEVIGQTAKRAGVDSWEKRNFVFDPEEKAVLIPETNLGVLICSDIRASNISFFNPEELDENLTLSGFENLVGHKTEFIHQEAKGMIVPTCWGMTENEVWKNLPSNTLDMLFQRGLTVEALGMMRHTPQIEEIAIIDRIPDVGEDFKGAVTTKPLNVFFSRK